MDNETTKNLVAAVRERDRRIEDLAQALVDQAAALDAALASERARIRARVEALDRGVGVVIGGEYRVVVVATDVLSAIDAIGGAS